MLIYAPMSKPELPSTASELPYATQNRIESIPKALLYPHYENPIFRHTDRTVYLDPGYKIAEEEERLANVNYVSAEFLFSQSGRENWGFADNLARELAAEGSPEYFEDMLKTLLQQDNIRLVHLITGVGTSQNTFYPSQTFGYVVPQESQD